MENEPVSIKASVAWVDLDRGIADIRLGDELAPARVAERVYPFENDIVTVEATPVRTRFGRDPDLTITGVVSRGIQASPVGVR